MARESRNEGDQEDKDQIIADTLNLRDDMADNLEMQDGSRRTAEIIIAALAAGVPLSYITIILFGHSLAP
jgi:hypothetical protein